MARAWRLFGGLMVDRPTTGAFGLVHIVCTLELLAGGLEIFGTAWKSLGSLWKCLDFFGNIWTSLENFGTTLEQLWNVFRTISTTQRSGSRSVPARRTLGQLWNNFGTVLEQAWSSPWNSSGAALEQFWNVFQTISRTQRSMPRSVPARRTLERVQGRVA